MKDTLQSEVLKNLVIFVTVLAILATFFTLALYLVVTFPIQQALPPMQVNRF
jgi:hypothetical protein